MPDLSFKFTTLQYTWYTLIVIARVAIRLEIYNQNKWDLSEY